jgi:hypothetical protein
MKTKQRTVRWPEWIEVAIEEWGKGNGKDSFSDAVVFLLETELNRMGYFRIDYEPGVMQKPVETKDKTAINPRKTG